MSPRAHENEQERDRSGMSLHLFCSELPLMCIFLAAAIMAGCHERCVDGTSPTIRPANTHNVTNPCRTMVLHLLIVGTVAVCYNPRLRVSRLSFVLGEMSGN